MKKALLATALVALMTVAAEAQVTLTYSRQTKNSSLTVTVSAGSYYGYGYGWGYGGGYFGGGYGAFGPGLVANVGGGTLTFGTRHILPYHGGGYGLYAGGYYAGYGYGYGFMPQPIADYAPPPPLRPGGVADRAHEHVAAKEIEEGRRRFRWGDYRGALDEFRSAVATDATSAPAHLYFAVALAVTGDGKNADKALRAGLERGSGKLSLEFRDDKERRRVVAALGKTTGDGSLAAAYALWLAGEPDRLRKLAEQDPAAKKLLAP